MCARASRSARKLAPVMTKRSTPERRRARAADRRRRRAGRRPRSGRRTPALSAAVCAAVLLQVLVAVVAAADLGDDGAVGLGQPGTGRARHRGEVGERGDAAADERAGRVEVGMAADVDVRAERDRRPGSRPASAAALRARSSAHATRSGSAPTASVTRSAMRAGELDHPRARRRDVERDLGLPGSGRATGGGSGGRRSRASRWRGTSAGR